MTEKQLKMRRLGTQASYLAACALHNTVAVVDGEWDLEGLYKFCKFHSVTAIVAMALEEVWKEYPAEPEIMQKWRQARDKAIRKNVLLNAERERILAYMESIGCWYMPLKGSLLQFDYPRFGMRQMSDNDILCDPEKCGALREFMVASGYRCNEFDQGHHDEYSRQPVYNYEFHRALFRKEEAPLLASYYADIHHRSLKDAGNQYGYHLSWSDFYIYLLAHAHNHYQESGIGIRFLMDVAVFREKHGAEIDVSHVEGELAKLGALEFEHCCRTLADLLFSTPRIIGEVSDEQMAALDVFFSSGAFGTVDQLLQKSYEKHKTQQNGSRFTYLLRRAFPPRELLGVMYPAVRKNGWLVPFVWVYRLIRSLLCSPRRVLMELKRFARKNQE